jgi:predicted dehydrogenase
MNRRQFIQTGAMAAAFSGMRSYAQETASQGKRVGVIGTGWYGKVDLFRLMQVAPVEVVSLCDVDRNLLSQAADLVSARQTSKKRPRTYSDYREMLQERDLDIVIICTPDHWHALPAIAAIQAGADVYLQKPISVDVIEGQAILAAARKHGKVVQVGTQRRSTPHLVEARDDYIRSGKLGKIAAVEIYLHAGAWSSRRPAQVPDVDPPAHLDWEMWTGPAPMRPYGRIVGRGWRSYMEYGNGMVGDIGIHMLDMVRWMLELGWPKSIASTGGILVHKNGPANIPDTQVATFQYDDLTLTWKHRTWGDTPDPRYAWAATFFGEKGTLRAGVYGYEFKPVGEGKPVEREVTYELEEYPEDKTEPRLEHFAAPAIRYHMKDFLSAIASRGKPVADIEEGHISTASCIMANLALELGRTLIWDPKTHRVTGDEEASRRLKRDYRAPWVHPDPEKV